MKPILLIGKSGAGKTTVANILRVFDFKEVTFAEPIKQFAISMGFKYHQVYGTQDQKLEINDYWGISAREFLQKFGTEVCREALPKLIPDLDIGNSTLWVKIAEYNMKQHKKVVVSDGRFPDEAMMVKNNGGIIIRINRGGAKTFEHKSETLMDQIPVDYTIDNDGSMTQLKQQVIDILDKEKMLECSESYHDCRRLVKRVFLAGVNMAIFY